MSALRNFTASLGLKIMGPIAILALTTAAATSVSLVAFGDTSRHFDRLVEEQAKVLEESTGLISDLTQMERAFATVRNAENEEALRARTAELEPVMANLKSRIGAALTAGTRDMTPKLATMEATIAQMSSARADEFTRMSEINTTLAGMGNANQSTAALAADAADTAYFDLVAGGELTVSHVKGTLEQLIAGDVGTIQLVLSVRGEVNVLRGVLPSLSAAQDAQRIAILTDISAAALYRLGDDAGRLSETEGAQTGLWSSARSCSTCVRFWPQRNAQTMDKPIPATMGKLDADIALWQDDLNFTLEFVAIKAADTNEAAILG